MPRLVIDPIDYLAPLAALAMFALAMLVFAFFLVNFFFISPTDDLTVFERYGAHYNVCLGPHALSSIYRGGPRATQKTEEHQQAQVMQQQ